MAVYLMKMFGISLALTIAIELVPAYILLEIRREKKESTGAAGERKTGKWPWLVISVNVLTNPPAVLLCWLGSMYLPSVPRILLQIPVELCVVAAEAWVYRSFAAKPGWGIRRPFLLSAAANICSWMTGVLAMWH